MPASPITESHSKIINGELDLTAMSIDCGDIGIKSIKDLLDDFDGKFIKLSISLKTEAVD
jgi:hypothetical protein